MTQSLELADENFKLIINNFVQENKRRYVIMNKKKNHSRETGTMKK